MRLRIKVTNKYHGAELRIHVVLVKETLQTPHDVESVRILHEILLRIPMKVPVLIYVKSFIIKFYSLGGKVDFFVLFHRKYVPLPSNGTTVGTRSEKALEVIPEHI